MDSYKSIGFQDIVKSISSGLVVNQSKISLIDQPTRKKLEVFILLFKK
jgi:hypothetical protein